MPTAENILVWVSALGFAHVVCLHAIWHSIHKRTIPAWFRMQRDLEDIFFNKVGSYKSTRLP